MNILRKRVILITVLTTLFMTFAGCGYQFRADGRPVGIEIESLAIPLMTSTSSVKGFEADFTRVIREEFLSHGQVPIVKREDASVVLTGRIYEIETRPLTYDIRQEIVNESVINYETTSRRRLKIRLGAQLTDSATGKIIWHDDSMEEEFRFDVGTDPLANRYARQQALMKIARLIAKRIYLKTMERF